MDARRALPFLLLVICAISAASIIRNGRGGPNNIRRIRRINLSEYLVPPPPPRFHPNRIPRLVTSQTTEAPGYFARLMNWFNPFGSDYSSKSSSLSPPPPPSPHVETPYPSSPKFISPPAEVYDPSPATYDKPPPPSSPFNNHPGYPSSGKAKNCNPCNKAPWTPIQNNKFHDSGDVSFAPPPPPPLPPQSSSNNQYLPPTNHEVPYDAHHAASQEIRAPDFSFASPSPPNGHDGSYINPLPHPHLYPGAIPPLFKAEDFNYSVEPISDSNTEYSDTPPPSVFNKIVSTKNGSFPDIAEFSFNSGSSVYPDVSSSDLGVIRQELGYTNSDTNNGEFEHFNAQNYGIHGDLSSSGTQVSQGHSDPISNGARFENTGTESALDSITHQTSFGNSDVLIDQNPPSSYGSSGPERIPGNLEHQDNDLSSSANVAQDSRTPLRVTDGSSAKIEDPIYFEESLLLDFTHKGESRTDSSSIPPTSNAFTDSTNTEASTLDEISETRHDITTTESYFSTDRFRSVNFVTPSDKSKINDSATQESNTDHKALRGQDVYYIPPTNQAGYLWPSDLSMTSKENLSTNLNTEHGMLFSTLNSLLHLYDDVAEETLDQNLNVKSKDANKTFTKQRDAKRNKQVQLIIPYTSQYTPLPFHSSHERTHEQEASHFASESNHDKYIGAESRNNIKMTSPPNSSHTWPVTSTLLENVTRKSVSTKVNNSIDVHKLQKNIDNWTIQEYSKGTTASTVSPSSANPYLFPSKQIPDKYLTTTESINRAIGSYDDNVKSFTLGGFSFNDLDYKASASNREERQRIQAIENSKSTERSIDTTVASTKDEITWQGFSVDISPGNKERVYVVTPQPVTTIPKSNFADKKKEKAAKEADRNSKVLEVDTKKTKKKSNTFESIEKAYQVLPQAVNNLAVASTGPESVPLWGIMEHEEFASLDENDHESEKSESLEIPVLYDGHSKVSRARR